MDRYPCNVVEINWRYHQKFDSARRSWLGRECTFQLQQLSSSEWGNSNLLNGSSQAFTRNCYCFIQKIEFLLVWVRWRYWSVKECTSKMMSFYPKMIDLFCHQPWSSVTPKLVYWSSKKHVYFIPIKCIKLCIMYLYQSINKMRCYYVIVENLYYHLYH